MRKWIATPIREWELAPDEVLEELSVKFKALSDPTRLKLLRLLRSRGEMCVCEMVAALGVSQSNLSFHLDVLRRAGFLRRRRQGQMNMYSIDLVAIEEFLGEFSEMFEG